MPEQQAVVVSFLARVADRRLLARRVKELGQILAKASPSWQQLLLEAASWTQILEHLEVPGSLGWSVGSSERGAEGRAFRKTVVFWDKALNVEMDSPVQGWNSRLNF